MTLGDTIGFGAVAEAAEVEVVVVAGRSDRFPAVLALWDVVGVVLVLSTRHAWHSAGVVAGGIIKSV